jgi:hypothetical protein
MIDFTRVDCKAFPRFREAVAVDAVSKRVSMRVGHMVFEIV